MPKSIRFFSWMYDVKNLVPYDNVAKLGPTRPSQIQNKKKEIELNKKRLLVYNYLI